jgi:hypothetical protein
MLLLAEERVDGLQARAFIKVGSPLWPCHEYHVHAENEGEWKAMETMSLVDALTTSAYHAAEAHDFGHTISACLNGRTGRYELSTTSGRSRFTHDFSTLDAMVDYLESVKQIEIGATSASGWEPLQ